MNGKAAQLERWLMAIRARVASNDAQAELTRSLGQVTCEDRWHSAFLAVGFGCAVCGAAV